MGEVNNRTSRKIRTNSEYKASGGSSSSNTETKSGETTRSGNGEGRENGVEFEELSEISLLEKKEERNRKRRERYAAKKAEEGKEVKPKKVGGRKKKNADPTLVEGVIRSLSSFFSSKPEFVFWQLSEKEINDLAQPIANLLEKSKAFEEITKHSDAIALTSASIMILAPRLFMTSQTLKSRKEKKHGDIKSTKINVETKSGDDEKRKNITDTGLPPGELTNTRDVIELNTNKQTFGNAIAY